MRRILAVFEDEDFKKFTDIKEELGMKWENFFLELLSNYKSKEELKKNG